MKRIPSLDGLRALSIALVLITHLAGTRGFFSIQAVARLGDLGNLGVRVFFVISGFLITQLLLLEAARAGGISLKAFYLRRLLRIFPAFYVFILVVSVLTFFGFIENDRRDFLHAVTYTMNYHTVTNNFALRHLWSLSVEEQFYFLWPLTLRLMGTIRSSLTLAGVIAVVPALRLVRFYLGGDFDSPAFEAVCDALATGCLLAIVMPTLATCAWYLRAIASPPFPLLLVAVLIANTQTDHPKLFSLACIPFMNAVIALAISRYVLFPRLIGARLLNTWPLVAIGVASYSLYLWQQLFLIQWRPPASVLQTFPANIVATSVCAGLSYWLVEKPFLRLKHYFQSDSTDHARHISGGPGSGAPVAESRL